MENSPKKQLFLFIFIVLIFVVASSIISSALLLALNSYTNTSIEDNTTFLRIIQMISTVGIFILPPLFFTRYYHFNKWQYFNLNHKPKLKLFILAILAIIAAQTLSSYLGYINQNMHLPDFLGGVEKWMRDKDSMNMILTEKLLQQNSIVDFFICSFVIAILPAIGEELLFRGTLQPLLIKIFKNKHWGIWITAFIFSAIHIQFLGFFPRLILGATFGYIVLYGKSLWLSMLCHFMNNFTAVLSYSLYKNHTMIDKNPIQSSGSIGIEWAILSAIVTIVIIICIKKVTDKDNISIV